MLPTKFVIQPSESLKCSHCRDLINDPVISTQCGHTFCRLCSAENNKCPIDKTALTSSDFVSNLAVKAQVEDLLIFCRHGLTRTDSEESFEIDDGGCPERITIGRRSEHEESCLYAVVPCPNSSNQCGTFRRRDLEEHLKVCNRYRCHFNGKGCDFVGTKDDIKRHYEICEYRNGDAKQKSMNQIEFDSLVHSNDELRSTVKVLSERVSWLEKNQDAMVTQVEQCNSAISRLTDTVEELSYQVDMLGSMLKRSSFYCEPSVTSIPDTVNSTSADELAHSPHRVNPRVRPVMPIQQEAWIIPCIFKCIGTLRGHRGAIWSLVSKGHRLFSGGSDGIKVWNMENVRMARCISSLDGHSSDIHTMCVGGGRLFSAGSDQTIIAWSLDTLKQHAKVEKAHDNIICAIVYNGRYVFTSSHSCITVWEPSTLELVHTINGLHHWVRALALDEKREKLISGSHNVIHIWDTSGSFALRRKIDHTHGSVYSITVTKQFIIVGTYNQNIHVFDVNGLQHVKALTTHFGTVTGLVVSGRLLFSASYDTTVHVCNHFTLRHCHWSRRVWTAPFLRLL
ncbi:E3 ubiquitin-protein ligase TRAF7 isoform X2 [Nematostella vectensis]|uniref:E3 ubiquitin-protein ligase TRAF7 isoform X2 n=1 Tax=Nematostella vectensis TaxID=45351 RepID=UPI0020778A14|nr:E3 ubiquitin-protein ligase TRAF7 isoform X2 [Nematostella vectensis]